MTPQEFASKVKAKYPEYGHLDDMDLANRIVAKHPEYGSQVDFGQNPNSPPPSDPNYSGPTNSSTPVQASLFSGLVPANAGYGPDVTRALLTNNQTEGMIEPVIRSIPSSVGGIAGAVGGSGAGPWGSIGGATLGGSAGESVRQALVNLYAANTGGQVAQPGEVLGNVATQGAVQGIGEGFGQALTGAVPLAKKIFAGQMRIGPNIDTHIGEAVLNDPDILSRALSPQEMRGEYSTFEKANDLISPRDARAAKGELIFKPGQAEDVVNDVYKRLTDNTAYLHGAKAPPAPTPQELYEASQAARFLRDQARFSNPNQAANLANINEAKTLIDRALEIVTEDSGESYAGLRKSNFESKAAGQFNSPYPINLNGQPNVLRSMSAMGSGAAAGASAGGLMAGPFGALVGAPLGAAAGYASVSPMVYGAAIRGANAISPALSFAGKSLRFVPGAVAAAAGGR